MVHFGGSAVLLARSFRSKSSVADRRGALAQQIIMRKEGRAKQCIRGSAPTTACLRERSKLDHNRSPPSQKA